MDASYDHMQQQIQAQQAQQQQPQAVAMGFNPNAARSLYVGSLDHRVTEPLLYEIFSAMGPVEQVKLIKDRVTAGSLGYGFVHFYDHASAARAVQQLNGRAVYDSEMKVNWAYAGGMPREDTSNHFHVFIGDLSTDIDDRALWEAFSPFGSISDARVMWDQNSGRSRGYGFVSFRIREDAEHAIRDMNGEWLGSRAIRVNWANQRTMQQQQQQRTSSSNMDYQAVFNASHPTNVTVYVGGLAPDATDEQVRATFSEYGFLDDLRIQRDKGYCFVRYQSHDNATRAIMGCNGRLLGSKSIKCSWGKEKTGTQQMDPYSAYYNQGAYAAQYANPYAYQQYYATGAYAQQAAGYGYGAYGNHAMYGQYQQTPQQGQQQGQQQQQPQHPQHQGQAPHH